MSSGLHIALVSYEFPPETGGGGIGTYLHQVSGMLARAGHDVEIFCGARGQASSSTNSEGVRVHRIPSAGSPDFRTAVLPVFARIHGERAFAVCEGTDFDASALEIKRTLPELPCVVKLHTPRFVIDELHHRTPPAWQRWRMFAGALRRGHWPRRTPPRRTATARIELEAIASADEIAAPSRAIAAAAKSWTTVSDERVSIFPYPYEPSAELLSIAPTAGDPNLVTFVGRIEERKGVVDLIHAIPAVLRLMPNARFRFVGRIMSAPDGRTDMERHLRTMLGTANAAVEFTGPVSPAAVTQALRATAILAAPSHWESFGIVCCEGLAAARAVVGSIEGGMAEILADGRCGVLVPPRRPDVLAAAIAGLLQDAGRREQLGIAGRAHLLATYSAAAVVPQQIASYQRAIARCRQSAPLVP